MSSSSKLPAFINHNVNNYSNLGPPKRRTNSPLRRSGSSKPPRSSNPTSMSILREENEPPNNTDGRNHRLPKYTPSRSRSRAASGRISKATFRRLQQLEKLGHHSTFTHGKPPRERNEYVLYNGGYRKKTVKRNKRQTNRK